jgi:hypothetical protein
MYKYIIETGEASRALRARNNRFHRGVAAMVSNPLTIGPSYVVNDDGERFGVLLPFDEYEKLLAANRSIDPSADIAHFHANKSSGRSRETESIPVHCYEKHAYARGIFFVESRKVTVFKGSSAAKWVASAMPDCYFSRRQKLIDDGVIVRDVNGDLKFVRDYTFRSASEAACVIGGGSRSGPETWKNIDNGKTLRSLGFSR